MKMWSPQTAPEQAGQAFTPLPGQPLTAQVGKTFDMACTNVDSSDTPRG